MIIVVEQAAALKPLRRKGNGALGARCGYIGSPTNLVGIDRAYCMSFYKIYQELSYLQLIFVQNHLSHTMFLQAPFERIPR